MKPQFQCYVVYSENASMSKVFNFEEGDQDNVIVISFAPRVGDVIKLFDKIYTVSYSMYDVAYNCHIIILNQIKLEGK